MHGDEESPAEDHDSHVFCDREALECNCVGELRSQETKVKERCEVVELAICEVVIWEEPEDGRRRNGVFVHVLHYVKSFICLFIYSKY